MIASDAEHLSCGLLADLTIEVIDRKTISIITDETWRASDKAIPQLVNSFGDQSMEATKIVAPYGGVHWGKRVQLP